jgi:hypothetical protein
LTKVFSAPGPLVAIALIFACVGRAEDLSKLRAELDLKIQELAAVVVREDIFRYSEAGRSVRKVDDFNAVVEIADGAELYSGVERNGRKYEHISQIEGIWSFGELVTLLRATRDSLNDCFPKTGAGVAENGSPFDLVTFHSPAGNRRWFAMIGSRVYWLEFEAEIRTSVLTGEILSLRWSSAVLPPLTGIERIVWSVEFLPVEIAGRLSAMPGTAEYRVTHTGNGHRAEWNITKFREWRRYGSQALVRFEETAPNAFPK